MQEAGLSFQDICLLKLVGTSDGHDFTRYKDSGHFLCLRASNLVVFLNNGYSWGLAHLAYSSCREEKTGSFLATEDLGGQDCLKEGKTETFSRSNEQTGIDVRRKREGGGRLVIKL